jgi:hypothetical protein
VASRDNELARHRCVGAAHLARPSQVAQPSCEVVGRRVSKTEPLMDSSARLSGRCRAAEHHREASRNRAAFATHLAAGALAAHSQQFAHLARPP